MKLCVIDACATTLAGAVDSPALAQSRLEQRLSSVPGLVLLSSCQPGQKSCQSDELKLGAYTHFLVKEIRENYGKIKDPGLVDWRSTSEATATSAMLWLKAAGWTNQTPWCLVSQAAVRQ